MCRTCIHSPFSEVGEEVKDEKIREGLIATEIYMYMDGRERNIPIHYARIRRHDHPCRLLRDNYRLSRILRLR